MNKPASVDLRAEAIRAALSAIAEANDGYLNPASVVEAARDPASVLHPEFEWDDAEAGHAYRVAQAGALIRRVKFTVVRANKETKQVQMHTTRAYQSRPSARNGKQGYEPVTEIMKDPTKRDELCAQVIKELAAYRKRYADIIALSEVWEAIDKAMDDVAPPQGKAAQAGHAVTTRGV